MALPDRHSSRASQRTTSNTANFTSYSLRALFFPFCSFCLISRVIPLSSFNVSWPSHFDAASRASHNIGFIICSYRIRTLYFAAKLIPLGGVLCAGTPNYTAHAGYTAYQMLAKTFSHLLGIHHHIFRRCQHLYK